MRPLLVSFLTFTLLFANGCSNFRSRLDSSDLPPPFTPESENSGCNVKLTLEADEILPGERIGLTGFSDQLPAALIEDALEIDDPQVSLVRQIGPGLYNGGSKSEYEVQIPFDFDLSRDPNGKMVTFRLRIETTKAKCETETQLRVHKGGETPLFTWDLILWAEFGVPDNQEIPQIAIFNTDQTRAIYDRFFPNFDNRPYPIFMKPGDRLVDFGPQNVNYTCQPPDPTTTFAKCVLLEDWLVPYQSDLDYDMAYAASQDEHLLSIYADVLNVASAKNRTDLRLTHIDDQVADVRMNIYLKNNLSNGDFNKRSSCHVPVPPSREVPLILWHYYWQIGLAENRATTARIDVTLESTIAADIPLCDIN